MASSQPRWSPELAALGYSEDLSRPCNMAIQATIASIRAQEVHTALIEHEQDALYRQDDEEPGQSFMLMLGIEQWFAVYLLAQTLGTSAALRKLEDLGSILSSTEGEDACELEIAQNKICAIEQALIRAERARAPNVNGKSPSSSASSSISSPAASPVEADIYSSPDAICTHIKSNPLMDMRWLTAEEKNEVVTSLTPEMSPTISPTVSEFEGEPFVPAFPPRYLEWEASLVDCAMWKIPNINNLSPISQDMWVAWASITPAEIQKCRLNARQGFTRSDKAPVYVSKWPISAFGPRFKCNVAAGARIRGALVTNNTRITDHKSKLWNWLRPFFRCSCYSSNSNTHRGQIVWFDHAVWYMLNHVESFFNASSLQGRLVLLIRFLSGEARKLVLDQIAFFTVRQYMLEGAMELVNHPEGRFFTQHESCKALRTIEALLKPGYFSDENTIAKVDESRVINLNQQPQQPAKRNGLIANIATNQGRGRGRGRGCIGWTVSNSFAIVVR